MLLQRLKQCLHDQHGMVLILVAAGLVVFLGLVALVTDVGLLYLNRVQLVNGVDAAALAGVMELPADDVRARAEAAYYAAANGLDPAALEVTVAPDKTAITVRARRTVPLFFARALGYREAAVGARAVARVAPVTAVRGVVPLGVEWEDFQFGEQYHLKYGGGSGTKGNYGALALGGTGAEQYEANLKYGFQDWLRVGDVVLTEPGNISGKTITGVNYRLDQCNHNPACTYTHFEPGCPRVVIIPVVEGLKQGRTAVEVVGFAAFFLEGVGGSGKDNYVTGRFIEMVVEGESSLTQQNFGLLAAKLID